MPRDASLGVEVTPKDRGPYDYFPDESRRDITGSEGAKESVGVSVSATEVTPVEKVLRTAPASEPAPRGALDWEWRQTRPRNMEPRENVSFESTPF